VNPAKRLLELARVHRRIEDDVTGPEDGVRWLRQRQQQRGYCQIELKVSL